MAFEDIIKDSKAFVLGLDNIVYPEKDYLLQVYYLFSEFMAYSEQADANQILAFMKTEFEQTGVEEIFEKTASNFNLPDKYKANFDLLHQNARLPLKLLLYKQVLTFLQEVIVERKNIFLLVDGDPAMQLNKIKQTEWNGLDQYMKLYFTAEFKPKPNANSLQFIMESNEVFQADILLIGNAETDELFAQNAGVKYFNVTKLL
ncbi:MAG: HAD family hydrolase [Flavobacterium sp.]|nr:MAG: HAD family hydrolase [Flavobacterium sp.]